MKKILYALLIVNSSCFFSSCVVDRTVSKWDLSEGQSLKDAVLHHGDIDRYNDLTLYYDEKVMDPDYLDLSKLMFEKYHYDIALYRIYLAYIYKYNPTNLFDSGNHTILINNLPEQEKMEALKYLQLGADKDDANCLRTLKEYYSSIGDTKKVEEIELRMKKIEEERLKKLEKIRLENK